MMGSGWDKRPGAAHRPIMTTTSRERLTRDRDGYTTADGYLIERCAGNQWNVYVPGDRTYPAGCIIEGALNIAEALATVADHRANG